MKKLILLGTMILALAATSAFAFPKNAVPNTLTNGWMNNQDKPAEKGEKKKKSGGKKKKGEKKPEEKKS